MAWTGLWRGAAATGSNEHLAERCRDDLCPRLPCRLFKAGYAAAAEIEYARGFRDGESAGAARAWQQGFSAGMAAAAKG